MMKKFTLFILFLCCMNNSNAQKVLYSNVYNYSHSDLVHMIKNYGAYTLDMYDEMLETNANPLVIYDNGKMLGTDIFNSMEDIEEFINNLESARKNKTYSTTLNYSLSNGPFGSVVAYIPGKGEMHFSKYAVKSLKKAIYK